ncbi:MAG: MtnX-like HAD-IB family phosphatase [Dehalococcoidia bacterium]
MQTLVQCDFDGTITEEDASFFLLDAFAQGEWRRLLRDYKEHRISVGHFNTAAFAMVKADRHTLLEALKDKVKMRSGLRELVDYCLSKDFRFVIVSNGLDFYINAILRDVGLENMEVHAARTSFHAQGMEVQYVGPDGRPLEDGFKEAYIRSFLRLGYTVVYVGNGDSDVAPAKHAHHVLATGELLSHCRENNLNCRSFESFIDAIGHLEQISQV